MLASPHTNLLVSLVWIDMLALDGRFTAGLAARRMQDPRVRQFHDPGKWAGRALAESLGGPGKVAWDVYLFYAPGAVWGDSPPLPVRWTHQLSDSWADPAHYRHGASLVEELAQAMNELRGS